MTIGDRIKAKRLRLDLTLEDVSKVVGITRQTVQKYESGVVSNIPSDKIELLAKALKTSPGYLMGWTYDAQIEEAQQQISELKADLKAVSSPERKQEILDVIEVLTESIRDMLFASELQTNLKPTPVSESGPLNPIAARIMESLDYLSPDQLETIAALTETLRRGKEHK